MTLVEWWSAHFISGCYGAMMFALLAPRLLRLLPKHARENAAESYRNAATFIDGRKALVIDPTNHFSGDDIIRGIEANASAVFDSAMIAKNTRVDLDRLLRKVPAP